MDDNVVKKIETFFSQYPKRSYPKDQIIVFSGESPEKIFHIISGKISQYDISYRGDEIVINMFKSPAFFPMSWAINKTPNKYFFKADEETIVYVAPPEEVVTFIKENPDVMFDLLSRLYNGVEGILARTVHLMAGSARSRIMYELLVEASRFGKKQPDSTIQLSISESELASHAGLARETVSREMKHLKEKGIAEIIGTSIIIKNIEELKKQLGQSA